MTEKQLPPHDQRAEMAVVGALMIDPDAYLDIRPILEPDDFYIVKNGWVYEAMIALRDRDVPLDFVTLCEELERAGRLEEIGGSAYLAKLFNETPTSVHAKYYAKVVQRKAIRRRLIRAAARVTQLAYDEGQELDELIRTAPMAMLKAQRDETAATDAYGLMSRLMDVASEWSANPLQPGEVRGLSTGIRPLDLATGGLESGLYLLAARPSMGKTALALQIASNIAEAGGRVLFVSLEMTEEQIGFRLTSSLARVELDKIKRGTASSEEYARWVGAMGDISTWPLVIVTGSMSASQIRAIVQREQITSDVAAVFVDGFWLLSGAKRAENRNLELGAMSRELKLAADDLRVPIMAVHQLSRGVEQRADKRPMLADLRESGRLEEDADMVLMLYRDGYYDPHSPDANVMEVWIRKNRLGGPAGRCVKLFWQGRYMRCAPLERG